LQLGLRVGGHLALTDFHSEDLSELSLSVINSHTWLRVVGDSTINIFLGIIIIIIYHYTMFPVRQPHVWTSVTDFVVYPSYGFKGQVRGRSSMTTLPAVLCELAPPILSMVAYNLHKFSERGLLLLNCKDCRTTTRIICPFEPNYAS